MGLLAHFLKGPRHVLYSHPGLPLSPEGRSALLALLPLLQGFPVAHVYAADSLAEAEAARLFGAFKTTRGGGYDTRAGKVETNDGI